jgi:hypothetical protein
VYAQHQLPHLVLISPQAAFVAGASFIVGFSMETFMVHTGFYKIVTQKEADRRQEAIVIPNQIIAHRFLYSHLRSFAFPFGDLLCYGSVLIHFHLSSSALTSPRRLKRNSFALACGDGTTCGNTKQPETLTLICLIPQTLNLLNIIFKESLPFDSMHQCRLLLDA